MKTPDSDIRASSYDPASMPASSLSTLRAVWYRRPWFLVTVVVVIVVAVSVLTDLPHPVTRASDAALQNDTITLINTDIAPCSFALKESFSFYNELRSGTLSASNIAQVPKLLTDDQVSCTLASGPIYDLTNNIEPSNTRAGKYIQSMSVLVISWATNDAKDAIYDIINCFKRPKVTHSTWTRDLTLREAYLSSDRTKILNLVRLAGHTVDQTLLAVNIPVLPPLLGT